MVERHPNPWISAKRAAERLGISQLTVHKLAILGRLRVLVEPDDNIRFSYEDVERHAQEHPAAATA